MKTVIIDNYDSFTYNLAHLVKELGAEVNVLRNDKFRLEELEPYDKIILSPDRKSTRLNSSHIEESRMPSSA